MNILKDDFVGGLLIGIFLTMMVVFICERLIQPPNVYYVRVIDTHDIVGRKVAVFNGENISFYRYGDVSESEATTTLCLINKYPETPPTCFYVERFHPFDAETQVLKFVAAWK